MADLVTLDLRAEVCGVCGQFRTGWRGVKFVDVDIDGWWGGGVVGLWWLESLDGSLVLW